MNLDGRAFLFENWERSICLAFTADRCRRVESDIQERSPPTSSPLQSETKARAVSDTPYTFDPKTGEVRLEKPEERLFLTWERGQVCLASSRSYWEVEPDDLPQAFQQALRGEPR